MKNLDNMKENPQKRNYPFIVYIILAGVFSENSYAFSDALKIKISKGNHSDETVIRFMPGATTKFEGCCDAWKIFSSNPILPNLFTKIDSGNNLTINALPPFLTSYKVDVYVRIGLEGYYLISGEEMGHFAPGACIMMKDNATGQLYDLRSNNTYLMHLPVLSQNDPPRFTVIFIVPAIVQIVNVSCNGCVDGKITIKKYGYTNWLYMLEDAGGNIITSGIAASDTVTVAGLAGGHDTLIIYTPFGCSESFPITLDSLSNTGIASNDIFSNMDIWCNGSNFIIETYFEHNTDLSLDIFDLAGKMIMHFGFSNIQNLQSELILSSIAPGLCFVVARTNDAVFAKKLIKIN